MIYANYITLGGTTKKKKKKTNNNDNKARSLVPAALALSLVVAGRERVWLFTSLRTARPTSAGQLMLSNAFALSIPLQTQGQSNNKIILGEKTKKRKEERGGEGGRRGGGRGDNKIMLYYIRKHTSAFLQICPW